MFCKYYKQVNLIRYKNTRRCLHIQINSLFCHINYCAPHNNAYLKQHGKTQLTPFKYKQLQTIAICNGDFLQHVREKNTICIFDI